MKFQFKRFGLFLLISILLIVPDYITKQLAVQYLSDGTKITILKRMLYLLYVENRGAAFGVFQGAQFMFYVITVVVMGAILYVVNRLPKEKKYVPLFVVSVLIFAGAIGNFIDRIKQQYVVDFIYFSPIDFPVFNVADIYVTCGCLLMILLFLFYYKDEDFWFMKAGTQDHITTGKG